MKALLEFALPEDAEEYAYARNGALYAGALAEFREWLRGLRKYNELEGSAHDFAERAWRELHELTEDLSFP